MILPGTYKAKISGYKMRSDKNGNPMIVVRFRFKDDLGAEHEVDWRGGFSEKGRKFTIEALLVMGFTGNDPSLLVDGPPSGLLSTDKTIQIVVAIEEFNGKEFPTVKWVNEVGGKPKTADLDKAGAKAAFAKVGNLAGDFAAARAEKKATNGQLDEPLPF